MSIQTTNETITVTVPEIPYLSSYPLSISLPVNTLKTCMRLVVIISTYILFRPHLERLFRRVLGREDTDAPQSVQDLKSRMKDLEGERGQPIGGGRKAAVVTSTGSAPVVNQGQTPKTRRKV